MPEVGIVTGHASGLGWAITQELLARGVTVVGVSRRARQGPKDDRLIEVQGTVAQQATVDEVFEAAQAAGQLRVVVNCAGQGVFGEVGGYSVDDVRKAIEGNLIGLIAFTDRAVAAMKASGGDIVNVMSTASKKLRIAESVYTAAKWGAKAYTRTVRDALKSAKIPIRVFEVYPCGMKTRFWQDAVRPVTDGATFPEPAPIARTVVDAIHAKADSYLQEFTFERS